MLDLDKESLNQLKLLSIVSCPGTDDWIQIKSQKELDSIIKNWNSHYVGLPLNQQTILLLCPDNSYYLEGEYGATYLLRNEFPKIIVKIHATSGEEIEFFENFHVYIDNTPITFSYIHQLQNYLDQFNFERIMVGKYLSRGPNGLGLN